MLPPKFIQDRKSRINWPTRDSLNWPTRDSLNWISNSNFLYRNLLSIKSEEENIDSGSHLHIHFWIFWTLGCSILKNTRWFINALYYRLNSFTGSSSPCICTAGILLKLLLAEKSSRFAEIHLIIIFIMCRIHCLFYVWARWNSNTIGSPPIHNTINFPILFIVSRLKLYSLGLNFVGIAFPALGLIKWLARNIGESRKVWKNRTRQQK
jgi:hypothetical protein